MMGLLSAAAVALLASLAAAKTCINATVPVNVDARTGLFNIATPLTNLDATTLASNFTQQGRNFTQFALEGYQTINKRYNISTEFCMPDSMASSQGSWGSSSATSPVVQVLTHGIGFDKAYWDLSYNNYNYSYVDYATDHYGYCTLAYDRLGIGNSSHAVDPLATVDEIQASLEIAALHELTQMLRAGTFPSALGHAFQKVIHVGHSFGSAQTYGLVAMYPSDSDGIVLTGFSMNGSFIGLFFAGVNFVQAKENQPRLDSYVNGYLVYSDIEANQYLFFYPGYFDMGILELAEMAKQPVTTGELFTLGSGPMVNPFTGPVLVITGGKPSFRQSSLLICIVLTAILQSKTCLTAVGLVLPQEIQLLPPFQQQSR